MRKTITVSTQKVEASDSLINGNSNMVFGNNNLIHGDNNKVYGSNNVVVGTGNVVKGEYNSARGSGNEILDPFGNFSPSNPPAFSPSNPPALHLASPPTSPVPFNNNPFSTPDNSAFSFAPIESPRNNPPPLSFTPLESPRGGNNNNSGFAAPPMISPRAMRSPTPTSSGSSHVFLPIPQPQFNNSYPSNPPNNQSFFQPISLNSSANENAFRGAPSPVPTNGSYFQQPAPFSPPQTVLVLQQPIIYATNPFSSSTENGNDNAAVIEKREKKNDIIKDGTLVFMLNEWEADYVQEFCDQLKANSGQQVSWHNSCGRTCIVGMGDLEKVRGTLIQLLPALNLRLKEWSWNTFGKNVCSDKDVYFKKLFKEYTRADVDCWRNPKPDAIKIPE